MAKLFASVCIVISLIGIWLEHQSAHYGSVKQNINKP